MLKLFSIAYQYVILRAYDEIIFSSLPCYFYEYDKHLMFS